MRPFPIPDESGSTLGALSMAFTTTRAFIQALGGLSITGVRRQYSEPPRQVNQADLPCSYPRLPEADGVADSTFGGVRGLRAVRADLVILVNPVLNNTQSVNFATALDLMDALHTALESNITALGLDNWSIRGEQDVIGDTAYWAIVATVEASG